MKKSGFYLSLDTTNMISNEFYIKDDFLIIIYNSKQKLRIIYSNKNLSELYKQIKCNNSKIKKCLTVK